MPTSCKEAIKRWEASTGQAPGEATEVKLIAMIPSMDKMDESLSVFENVTKLSLSTNAIERIQFLKFKNLQILSIGRNNVKRIQGLEEVSATLLELWISYNQIEKLEGLSSLAKLHTLFIGNNKVKSWDEVSKLAQLPELKTILLVGNPCYTGRDERETYKEVNAPIVVKRIPQIETVDGKMVSAATRAAAEGMD